MLGKTDSTCTNQPSLHNSTPPVLCGVVCGVVWEGLVGTCGVVWEGLVGTVVWVRVGCTTGVMWRELVVREVLWVAGLGASWSYVLDRDVEVCRKGWSYVCCVGRVGRTC